MGTTAEIWVPLVISTVATAASTGISMYAQNEQAKTAQRLADYNAAIQRQDADVQTRLAQYQANVNAQAAQAQAQAQVNNAQSIANQVPGVEAQSRERARRMREEQDRLSALQRARYAKSGVVNEGSPLVVLAETAQLAELNIHDAQYESEMQRQDLLRRAELENFQAGFSLLEAGQQQYQGLAAQANRRIRYREADMTRRAGGAQASAYRMGATASLVSGLGSHAQTGLDYGYKMAPTTRSLTATPKTSTSIS